MKNWYALQVILYEIDAFFHWYDNFFLKEGLYIFPTKNDLESKKES